MDIEEKNMNTNSQWKIYELKNDNGMEVHILNFGGKITKVLTANKFGEFENVVLSYKNVEDYEYDTNFLGTLIGPVAGRIKNAQFSINEEVHHLEENDGENNLHSGSVGLQNSLWEGKSFLDSDVAGVELEYNSKDGEFGFPGNKRIVVTYTLTNKDEIIIGYQVETDQATPIILTNHSYFNLTGDLKETIENHHVTFNSSKFAELDQNLIPTGDLVDVSDTPFDFRSGRTLNEGINSNFEQNEVVGEWI